MRSLSFIDMYIIEGLRILAPGKLSSLQCIILLLNEVLESVYEQNCIGGTVLALMMRTRTLLAVPRRAPGRIAKEADITLITMRSSGVVHAALE